MTVRLATSTSRALLDQIRGCRRSELTLLLGENAVAPGFTGDEQAVKEQLERGLSGDDPAVSETVRRHISGILSTATDVSLLIMLGIDPGVAAFHALSMGGLAFTSGDRSVQITTRIGNRVPRMTFDLPLGEEATWSTNAERTLIGIAGMPESMAAMLSGRIADGEQVALATVLSHPVLDAVDLDISGIRMTDWGGARLTIAPHPFIADLPVSDLLAHTGS